MVNTSLDKKYEAKESTMQEFELLAEGKYTVRVKEISPWKEQTKDIKVILRDEKGNALLDENGEKKTEMVKDCKYYNCLVRFEVVGGKYEGRLLFHNLTTHPNMSYSIGAFLYALDESSLAASEIPTVCVGKCCEAVVTKGKYIKKVTDKDTGIETEEEKEKNEIKYLNKLPKTDTTDPTNVIEDF